MTWRVSLTAPGADQQVHLRASKDAPAAEALQPAVAASRRVAWSKGFGTFGRGAVNRHQLMKHIVCAMLEQHHIVWSVARIAASAPAISSSLCGIARLCIFRLIIPSYSWSKCPVTRNESTFSYKQHWQARSAGINMIHELSKPKLRSFDSELLGS